MDAHDTARVSEARKELHRLLEDRCGPRGRRGAPAAARLTGRPRRAASFSDLATTPILVLANKIDLQPHLSEPQIIEGLNLDYIVDNPWLVIPCSALRSINIERVLEWLIARGR